MSKEQKSTRVLSLAKASDNIKSKSATAKETKAEKSAQKTSHHAQTMAAAKANAEKGLPLLNHLTNKRKVIIMLAVMCAMFLVSLDQTIVATALTHIVDDFHSFSKMSWVVTAYLLTITVSVPLSGKISDLFGRKPVLLFGVALFAISSLFTGSSGNIDWLIIFRAVQGIGAGVIMANAFTIIGDLFTPRERGKWQGLISAVFAVAAAAGPLIGGYFSDAGWFFGLATSWRWNFWLNVPIGIFAFAMITIFSPNIKHAKRAKIDYAGALFMTIALVAIVLATDNTSSIFASWISAGWSLAVVRLVWFAIAAVAVGIFILVERKAESPILSLSFFKNRTFATGQIAMLLFGAAFMSMILYTTQFNQQVFGATATSSGLMLLPAVLSMGFMSAMTGQIITKTGRYKLQMVLGFVAIVIAGVWWALTLTADSRFIQEAMILVLAGLGMGSAMPALNLAVQNSVHQKDIGVATSSVQLFRSLGQTIGTAVLGSMLTAGVAAGLGNISKIPFIQAINNSPQAAQVLDGQKIDADFALSLNTPEMSKKISASVNSAILAQVDAKLNQAKQETAAKIKERISAQLPAGLNQTQRDQLIKEKSASLIAESNAKIAAQKPAAIRQATNNFNNIKADFSTKVVDSFTRELNQIFWAVSVIAAIGTLIVAVGLKEHRLRGSLEGAPGVDEKELAKN